MIGDKGETSSIGITRQVLQSVHFYVEAQILHAILHPAHPFRFAFAQNEFVEPFLVNNALEVVDQKAGNKASLAPHLVAQHLFDVDDFGLCHLNKTL